MKVLQVKRTPIYDIFLGDGWYNWTRILFRQQIIKVLAGSPLSKDQQLQLQVVLNVGGL